jgi:hypothetical protein
MTKFRYLVLYFLSFCQSDLFAALPVQQPYLSRIECFDRSSSQTMALKEEIGSIWADVPIRSSVANW